MKIQLGKSKATGTTLVDVVMAVAIVGIMACGLVGSLTYGFFTMGRARENQRATQILLETVETIRLYNWAQVKSNGFIPTTFTSVYDPQTTNQGLVYYGTIETTQANVGASINTNLIMMTVNVRWTNQNIPHVRTVTTHIAKDGLQPYIF